MLLIPASFPAINSKRIPARSYLFPRAFLPFKHTGWYPEIQAGMAAIDPESFVGTPLYDAYMRVAPKPEDFFRFATAMREAMSRDYDWKDSISALTEGGTVFMPLDRYPFSEKFGWIADKYGVSWQLNLQGN